MNTQLRWSAGAAAACLVLGALTSMGAQGATQEATAEAIRDSFAKPGSFAVPESPAAALLGTSVATLSRPQSVQHLAMELAEVGEGAKKAKGFSLSFAPAVIWGGEGLTIEKYRAKEARALRAWANTEVSLGLTDPDGDEQATRRAALGLSWTVFDKGDPRRDTVLNQCLMDAHQTLFQADAPAFPGDNSSWARAVANIQPVVKKCTEASATRQRSSSSMKLGLATGWANAPQGDGWKGGAGGFWLSGMYVPEPKADKAPSRLRLLYRIQDTRLNNWSSTRLTWEKEHTRSATLQLRYDADGKGADAILELGVDRDAATSRQVKRVSLGFERQVMDGLWLVLSVTAKSGEDPGRPNTLVLGKLKYAFGADPVLLQTKTSAP